MKNEIDYILTNNNAMRKDVDVLIRFQTGSDHRKARTRIVPNLKLQIIRLIDAQAKIGININNLTVITEECDRILYNEIQKNINSSQLLEK